MRRSYELPAVVLKEFVTIQEAAGILGVHYSTARHYIITSRLTLYRAAGSHAPGFLRRKDVMKFKRLGGNHEGQRSKTA